MSPLDPKDPFYYHRLAGRSPDMDRIRKLEEEIERLADENLYLWQLVSLLKETVSITEECKRHHRETERLLKKILVDEK